MAFKEKTGSKKRVRQEEGTIGWGTGDKGDGYFLGAKKGRRSGGTSGYGEH